MSSPSASFRSANAVPYESTGKLGPALFMLPLVMFVATPLWATIYAYIDVYCPVAGWISIVFVGVFAAGFAVAASSVAHFFRCRSPKFVALIGLLSAAYGLYCSWVVFEYALLHRQELPVEIDFWDLASSPSAVWEIAQAINEEGWYKIKSLTPKGFVLWAFWAIEAAAVLIAGLLSFALLPDRMYCEPCNRWCDEKHKDTRFAAPGDLESLHGLAAGDVRQIELLQPPSSVGPLEPLVQLAINRCENCQNTAGMRVSLVERSLDKDGDVTESVKPAGPFMLLTRDAYRELEAQLEAAAARSTTAAEVPTDSPSSADEASPPSAES